MGGIYESGYKLLLLRGLDHCLPCLSAQFVCLVCAASLKIYPVMLLDIKVGWWAKVACFL